MGRRRRTHRYEDGATISTPADSPPPPPPSRRWVKPAAILCGGVLLAAGLGWLVYTLQKPRVLRVAVFTDFAFRQKRPDWERIVRERIASVNEIYRPAGVRWEVVSLDRADPTIGRPGMDLRRRRLAAAPGPAADVFLGFAGSTVEPEGGGVLPFTHAAMVLDTAGDFPADRLAGELSGLFGAPKESQSPGALSSAAETLIRRVRHYDFEHGTEELAGDGGNRAVDALANAYRKVTPNFQARAHVVVARSLISEHRLEAGVTHLRRALKLDPNDASARLTLAAALTENGDLPAAAAALREGASGAPTNDRLRAGSAAMDAAVTKQSEALLQLTDMITRYAKDPELNAVLGWLFLPEAALINKSVAAFENAREADPESPFALRGLERADIVRQVAWIDIQRAREAARQSPANPEAHFVLGVKYTMAGEFDSAQQEFERVVALKPSSGRAHVNLAILDWLKRDYAAAEREVAAARKDGVEPSSELVRVIRKAGQ